MTKKDEIIQARISNQKIMALQAIGVTIGLIGFFTKIEIIVLFGGTICLFLDLSEIFAGRLRVYRPLFFYFLGFIYFQSFVGIFYGAIANNFINLAICPIKIMSGDIDISFKNKRKKSNAFKGISYKINKDIRKKKLKDVRK